MASGRIYTVHVRGAGTADRDVAFAKEGFAWPAFLFTFIWALWNRMWLFALLILAGSVAIGFASEVLGLDPLTDAAVGLAWALLIGFEGNDARRRALAKRGFAMVDVVYGADLPAAEHRFFAKHRPAPAPA